MSNAIKKMSLGEQANIASNFVPLGQERKTGEEVADGFISLDLSKKLPENLSLAQAWAQNVVLNHADKLEAMGTTKHGFSYAEPFKAAYSV